MKKFSKRILVYNYLNYIYPILVVHTYMHVSEYVSLRYKFHLDETWWDWWDKIATCLYSIAIQQMSICQSIRTTRAYRTLHSYKLLWAVCHLFPQRWRTLTYSVSGNHWPGGPRDMLKTTSARKFKSCVFEPPTRRVFSINTSSSNTLVLFYEISSQRQHTTSSVNQQE